MSSTPATSAVAPLASVPAGATALQMKGGAPAGRMQGQAHGSPVSIFFVSTDEPGVGPRLHRHPYPETFVVHAGRAEFTVGDQQLVAGAGDVLVAAAGVAHKFVNLGPDRLVMTNIHASPVFEQEDLE